MAIPHATAGEVIDVRPLGAEFSHAVTKMLFKTSGLEVIRLVVPAGKEIPPHRVDKEITIQCLEGRVVLTAGGRTSELAAGQLVFLSGGTEHSVRGLEDASLLLTILR